MMFGAVCKGDSYMNVKAKHRVLFSGPFETCNLGLKLKLWPLLSWRLLLLCLLRMSVWPGLCLGFTAVLGSVVSLGGRTSLRFIRRFRYR